MSLRIRGMRWQIAVGIFALICILIPCATLAYLNTPMRPASRNIDPLRLLVDPAVFPSDWYVEIGPVMLPERLVENGTRHVVTIEARSSADTHLYASHTIFEYLAVMEAALWYTTVNDFPSEFVTPLTSVDWDYVSDVAYRYRFRCAISSNNDLRFCSAIAQYGQFVSMLSIRGSNSEIYPSLENIQAILRAIDDNFRPIMDD